MRRSRRWSPGGSAGFAGVAAILIVTALSGCVTGPPAPVPTYTPSSSASPAPTPGPTGTVAPGPGAILRPGGNAAQNQLFFDYVASSLFATNGFTDGRTIIDTLVAAGFVKADMEVTYDSTAIGLRADSIVFSVRMPDKCLIGQFSNAGYVGVIAPILGTGKCLVGDTKPIDW